MPSGRTRVLGGVVAIVMVVGCSGGQERSTEEFCDTFESEAVRLRDKYESRLSGLDSEADPLGSLLLAMGSLVEAQGDFVVLLERLERAAPKEISPEVAAARDAMKKQVDAAGESLGDPLGALGTSLITGLASLGSFEQVERFVRENCDLSFITSQ